MLDVNKIAQGSRNFYNLAPSPASFFVLVKGAMAATRNLQAEFAVLPAALQKANTAWSIRATKYLARLEQESLQAEVIVKMIAAGNADWQAALVAGTNYATALAKVLVGGDSAVWARLTNELADIQALEDKANQKSFFDKTAFVMGVLGGPWQGAMVKGIGELTEKAQTGELKTMGQAAGAAYDSIFGSLKDYLTKGAIGLAVLVAGAAVAYFVFTGND